MKHAKSALKAILAAVLTIVTGAVPSTLNWLWRLLFDHHTCTYTIPKSDPLYATALTFLARLPSMRKVSRFAATAGPDAPLQEHEIASDETLAKAIVQNAGSAVSEDSDYHSPDYVWGSSEVASIQPVGYPGQTLLGSSGDGNSQIPIWGAMQTLGGGSVEVRPAVSVHSFRYKGARIHARIVTEPGIRKDSIVETLELVSARRRPGGNGGIQTLLADIAAFRQAQRTVASEIWVSDEGDWRQISQRKMRQASSVILDGVSIDEIIEDARRFLAEQAWYENMGIPYRRGYLLYGPPGCGKTSTIQVVAGALNLNLFVLRLAEDGMTDNRLERLTRRVGRGSILMVEDVDVAMISRSRDEDREENARLKGWYQDMRDTTSPVDPNPPVRSRVTMSGLLNALDGVTAGEGRLLFLTTNHREKLDPALIRPGRVDRQIEIGYASETQALRLFERFFPLAGREILDEFHSGMLGTEVTMAELQEYLLERRESAIIAAGEFRQWIGERAKKQKEQP